MATTSTTVNPLQDFRWEPQPAAAALVLDIVNRVLAGNGFARNLAQRMQAETATRFSDWLDHLRISADDHAAARLTSVGYERTQEIGAGEVYVHHKGLFPRIAVRGEGIAAAIKVDSAADFVRAQGLTTATHGVEGGQYREVLAAAGNGTELWAIERHGYRGLTAPETHPERIAAARQHLQAFRNRLRTGPEHEAFTHLHVMLRTAIDDLGVDWTCDLFFRAEREYWQTRNRAAQVQKARQDVLGLGWANHDHHTYRSSRRHFAELIGLWELLGFTLRERFYAGLEAGWGAQVAEQPVTGIITFNDVDMSPEELLGDFAHEPLPESDSLGTIGLWCALHGEALFQAGMHHLECQFDFDLLRDQLQAAGVGTMKPFTNFEYLTQAFTEGERWQVDPQRIERLVRSGQITLEQAARFQQEGAIGSHLENLERNQGFKGFNQQGVSDIIARTDPRRQ